MCLDCVSSVMRTLAWLKPLDEKIKINVLNFTGLPGGSDGKESASNEGNPGFIPGLERSPWEGNGNPCQYSWLKNFIDRGASLATVHGVTKSQILLSDSCHVSLITYEPRLSSPGFSSGILLAVVSLALFVFQFSSVQFSCSVVSNSLWLHGLQQARPPCPSPIPGVYPNSCSLSQWCHPTISSSVIPLSSCLQSFPASGSFQMSQFLPSYGQYLKFQLQHQSFQWIFRTNSFRTDWFDLLAVQGALKSQGVLLIIAI